MQNPTALDVFAIETSSPHRGRFAASFVAGILVPLITSCGSVPTETEHAATSDGTTAHSASSSTAQGAGTSLADAQTEIAHRSEAVLDATDRRRRWTKTLDELITVITEGERTSRHVAWLRSIRLEHDTAGPKLVASGAVAGGDIRKIANLHDDLQAASFFGEITKYSPPGGVRKIDRGVTPPESFAYRWRWEFASPEVATMPPSRPGGAGPVSPSSTVQMSEPEIRARYNELSTQLQQLPTTEDFSHFMRGAAEFAANSGISLDRFVPTRSASTKHGLTSVRCDLRFRATLWQAVEFVSFVENHDRAFHVRDFMLEAGEKPEDGRDAEHTCLVVVESFVYEPHATLEARFGTATGAAGKADTQHHHPGHQTHYEFAGRNGRRDILVDPRQKK